MDSDGLRALLLLAAGGVLAALSLEWVLGDAIGWTAYTPLEDDPTVAAVDRLYERANATGWELLGPATIGVVAALALVACAVRPPAGRVAVATGVVLAALAGAVAATSFDPDPIRAVVPSSGSDRPVPFDRDPGWGPYLALIALGLGGLGLALTAWRGRPRGAALLVAGGALLATSVLLPWEVGRNPLTGDTLGPGPSVLLLAAAAALVVAAARADATPNLVLLVAALAGIGVVCSFGFRGARPEGPYIALVGLAVAAVGLVARLTTARGAALAAVAGAVVLATTAFLPWGLITGDEASYFENVQPSSDLWRPGFVTSFDVAGNAFAPYLWVLAGGAVLVAALARRRTALLVLAGLAAGALVALLTQVEDERYPGLAPEVASVGVALALAGCLALAAQPKVNT